MVEQLLKNILNDDGKTKIDINEIARNSNGITELLGDIVNGAELNSNSNGHYIKWENGFAICWRSISFNRDTSTGVDNVPKPIVFKRTYPIIGGVGPPSSGGYRERNDLNILGMNNYYDRWSIGRSTLYSTWSGTGDFTVVVWAAGVVE